VGLILPADVSPDDRRTTLRAIGKVRHLALGRLGKWKIAAETSASPTWNLRPHVWTAHPRGATHWSTVTPVVFDRHPKTDERAAYQTEVALMIATACTRIGLPETRGPTQFRRTQCHRRSLPSSARTGKRAKARMRFLFSKSRIWAYLDRGGPFSWQGSVGR
jgi:CRISPR-associated protein Csb2